MSLIDREVLYEKACGLEAQAVQALAYVGKIANDETKIEEWRIWSAILAERTAFKHDIFDAPEVKPEMKWIPCSERLPEEFGEYLAYRKNGTVEKMFYNPILTTRYPKGFSIVNNNFSWRQDNVTAWMPLPVLPEPYEGE